MSLFLAFIGVGREVGYDDVFSGSILVFKGDENGVMLNWPADALVAKIAIAGMAELDIDPGIIKFLSCFLNFSSHYCGKLSHHSFLGLLTLFLSEFYTRLLSHCFRRPIYPFDAFLFHALLLQFLEGEIEALELHLIIFNGLSQQFILDFQLFVDGEKFQGFILKIV